MVTEPLPPLPTELPPPPITDNPPPSIPPSPVAQGVISAADIALGGYYLLPISILFIFTNGFLSWLVFKNWKTIKKSKFYTSFLLGVMLTLADMALALLVGLPAGLHLVWADYFRAQTVVRFYNRVLAYTLFEYIFLLRVLLIAALSTDAYLHIQLPFRYYDLVTNARARWASVVVAVLPLLVRSLPNVVFLGLSDCAMLCMYYTDPAVSASDLLLYHDNFSVPLSCATDIGNTTDSMSVHANAHAYVLPEVIILASITVLAWLVIVLSNAAMLTVVFRNVRGSSSLTLAKSTGPSRAGSITRNLTKSTLLVLCIAASFLLTNFPYVGVWWADYTYRTHYKTKPVNDRTRFYLTLLVFISLFVHPWLYLLRLQSVRDIILNFKRKFITSLSSNSTKRFSMSKLGSNGSSPVFVEEAKSPGSARGGDPLKGGKQNTNVAGQTSRSMLAGSHNYTARNRNV